MVTRKAFPSPCYKRHFATLAFAPNVATFTRLETDAIMSQPAFDPFGEPVPAVEQPIASDRASEWLKSAGTSLFWLLVAGIVAARAVYFEPGTFSFEKAVAWAQGLLAFL